MHSDLWNLIYLKHLIEYKLKKKMSERQSFALN